MAEKGMTRLHLLSYAALMDLFMGAQSGASSDRRSPIFSPALRLIVVIVISLILIRGSG
jgi:hypothetical protein